MLGFSVLMSSCLGRLCVKFNVSTAGDSYQVYGVVTKGKEEKPQTWVTQYRLRSSIDQEEWTYHKEDGEPKVRTFNSQP